MALTRKERIGLMAARRASLDVKATEAALDGKAPAVHGHAISDVSGLQTALDGKQPAGSYVLTVNFTWDNLGGKPSAFPPSAHSHAISDVTGLQTALDGKQPVGSYLTGITSGMVTTALGFTPANKAGDAFSGAVTFNGGINPSFEVRAEGGTEGGQFIMQKAPSGSTLSGNLVIDTVGDVFRVFDGGGSNPGAYLNIKSQNNAAGSRILTDTTLTSGNVTSALGFTPYNATNPAGYISGITSGMVTTALGFTPANKAGDAFSGPLYVNNGSHQVTIASDGNIEVARSGGGAYIDLKDSTGEDYDVRLQASGTALAIAAPGGLTLNGAAVLTGITSGQVTTALGYTPANKAGDTFTGTVTIPDLVVSGSLPVFSSGLFQYHQFQSPHVAFVKKTGGYQWYWRRNDTGLAGGANEVEDMSLTEGGSLIVRTDIRAPQFLDSEDTSYYLNPTGTSNLAGLAVANTITGNISGGANTANFLNGGGSSADVDNITNRVNSGFWQSSTGTTAEGWPLDSGGWQHMISCTHSNNSNYFAMQLGAGFFDQGLFYRSTNGGGSTPWSRVALYGNNYAGNLYASVYYDSGNTGYYVDPASTSNLLNITANYIRSFGNIDVDNDLVVGTASGKTSSYIYMKDVDEGDRAIHCNGNRIGFLTQGGGWGSWCEDDGSWRNTSYIQTPIIYDINNTGYYVDPASSSYLNAVTFDGLVTGRTSASTDVNSANDTGSFSVRGSTTTVAAMSFHRAGAYAMNIGLGTDNVFRIGGWSASSNCFQMDGSGNLAMLGNITAYSDARLKTDVETISGALDMVSSMRGVRYTRIDSGQRQVGVIAQEMQEVVPEVVQQGIGDDDTLSVAYGNLVGVLIEAVKELRAEVEALKSQGTMK